MYIAATAGMSCLAERPIDGSAAWFRNGKRSAMACDARLGVVRSGWTQITYGWTMLVREPDAAIDLLEPTVYFYRSLESIWLEGVAAVPLGEPYLRVGRLADARTTFERTIEITGARGMRLISAPAERLLAETLLAEGALNQAQSHFESIVADLEQSHAQGELALAWDGYGRVLARQGQVTEARRYVTQALIILGQLGMHRESQRVRAEFEALAVNS